MEYLNQRIEVVIQDFFLNMKYAKKVLSCKGWIMERGHEVRSIVLIKRRMADGTKRFVLKVEQNINSFEDVQYLEAMLKDLEHHLSKIVHLNCA